MMAVSLFFWSQKEKRHQKMWEVSEVFKIFWKLKKIHLIQDMRIFSIGILTGVPNCQIGKNDPDICTSTIYNHKTVGLSS